MYSEENKLMYFKTIIQGKLEFGNKNSYDKIVKMFQHRVDNYYRNIVMINIEDIFFEDNYTLFIKRFVGQATDKSWRNTADILEYCSQFAVSGTIGIWMTDNGQILKYRKIVPTGDKTAVKHFIKGRKLFKKENKPLEAIESINLAIDKYDRHANAYEIRAYINMKLGKYHDARRDFNKCLSIDENIPHAYFGRAQLAMLEGDTESAYKDFSETTKKAIALQPVFWKARRIMAQISLKKGDLNGAIFDLKVYSKRKFSKEDENYEWKRWALFNYGVLLLENEDFLDALAAFEETLTFTEGQKGDIGEAVVLRYRGITKKSAGKRGYLKDLKEASKLGDETAALLLKKK